MDNFLTLIFALIIYALAFASGYTMGKYRG